MKRDLGFEARGEICFVSVSLFCDSLRNVNTGVLNIESLHCPVGKLGVASYNHVLESEQVLACANICLHYANRTIPSFSVYRTMCSVYSAHT